MMKRLGLFCCVCLFGLYPSVASAADPQEEPSPPNALNMIEGVRGGRHWVDAETAPPKSPQDSLASLQDRIGL